MLHNPLITKALLRKQQRIQPFFNSSLGDDLEALGIGLGLSETIE